MVSKPKPITDREIKKAPTSVKCFMLCFTVLYLVLLPLSASFVSLSGMVFDNRDTTLPVGLSFMFLIFLIPLSMVVSICSMWSHYHRGQYNKMRFFWFFPILTFIVAFILIKILDKHFL
jgi:hypothetical protein